MFHFVVHHLRWFVKVPGFPHLFDALLLTTTCLFHRARLTAMETLEAETLRLLDVHLGIHRFGGVEFLGKEGKELGHLHGHGLLDVPVGQQAAGALIASGRVVPHHVFPRSKWVSFQLETKMDVPFALDLLTMARSNQESRSRHSE